MPSLLESPFVPPRQRKPGVAGLVGEVFGGKAKAAYEKQVGAEKKQRSVSDWREDWGGADIEISAEERSRMKTEAENRLWTREQYIEWAEEIGKDEKWVDATFLFHPDGTTEVEDALDLGRIGITHLPRGLRRVGGNLYLYDNPLTSLEGLPEEIGGSLYLANNYLTSLEGLSESIGGSLNLNDNQLTSLQGMPQEIGGNLDLSSNPLTTLEGLPERIGGNLYLHDVPATSIPSGLLIGKIWMRPNQFYLADDAKRKGYKVEIV